MNKKFLGKVRYVEDGFNISNEFKKNALEDENVAKILYKQGHYNQSIYFFIQSMEKYIKHFICNKVDITKEFFENKIRSTGHSLDLSIDFLIEIIAGNNIVVREQVKDQLKNKILRQIRFSHIYNAVRYPYYKDGIYKILEMSHKDCEIIMEIYDALKNTLKDLDKIY